MPDSDPAALPADDLQRLLSENARLSIGLTAQAQQVQLLEKLLRQSQRIHEVFIANALVLITDSNGVMSQVSDECCALSQYSRQELVGQKASMLNSGYHSPAFFAELWRTIASNQVWRGEIRNQAKDGSYYWVDMLIAPLSDEQGRIEHYLAIRTDVTKNKQAEAQMRFDAHILSHVNDAVVGLDAAYRVNYWNQGAQKQYGLAAHQVMGKPLSQAYESQWLQAADEERAMESLARSGSCQTELIHRLRDGRKLFVDATTQVLLNERGEKVGLLAVIRDVTQRKQGEHALQQALQQLERRNHELDNYVYKVSHDLRAPLTSMQGLLNLIKLEADGAAKETYLHLIESRVAKLDDYIQSILHHSKMVNAPLTITPVDLGAIARECFEELQHYTDWHQVSLQVSQRGEAVFRSDAFTVTVILKNLVTNAIKYRNPQVAQSYLHLDISLSAREALIRVSDNGIGIEEAYLDKIFKMFFRATAQSQGSGLGLYIVKQAIEKLDGRIQVESQRGKGTTFLIQLPSKAD